MDLPPEPPEFGAKREWIELWTTRAEAGERLPFHRSRLAEEISDLRDAWWQWYVKVREKNTRVKSGEDRTEASEAKWYFTTFTQPDTNTDPHEILKNTLKVIKSKMVFPIIAWCYSLELTQKGTPHTHIAFLTARRVEFTKINSFNCSNLKVRQRAETKAARYPQEAIDYVLKTDTKPSPEWLAEHNLTQCIWKSDNCPGSVINV